MDAGVAECSKQTIKGEPVFAVVKASKRECFRCGAGNFTIEQKKVLQQATNANIVISLDIWKDAVIKNTR